jgi:superfamily II DNA/RNA helicase
MVVSALFSILLLITFCFVLFCFVLFCAMLYYSGCRGLDIPAVKHVIQAEFAQNVVQHMHRSVWIFDI